MLHMLHRNFCILVLPIWVVQGVPYIIGDASIETCLVIKLFLSFLYQSTIEFKSMTAIFSHPIEGKSIRINNKI